MNAIVQLLCLVTLTGFGALLGLTTSRLLSRYMHQPENEVNFYGAFSALITGFTCFILMGLNMKEYHGIVSLIGSGLIALLSLLIYPVFLIGSIVIRRIVRRACDLVDGLFTR